MKRLLVIGAGLIGRRHIQLVQEHSACVLAGVVDPQAPDIALGNVPYFTDLGAVDVAVDGAIIATPTDLHADHAVAAARRGWHMLIEKPVTDYAEQADLVHAAATANGVQCLVGHHRRYHAAVQLLKQTIEDGFIGAAVGTTMLWSVRKPEAYFDTQWRQKGGSPVMINLIHDVDLLRFVFGEITDIAGFASAAQRQQGRVESGAVALRFASGLCGTLNFADTAPSPWGFEAAMAENPHIAASMQDMWWVTGTKGGIAFPSLHLWRGAEDWSQPQQAEKLSCAQTVPLVAQLEHFIAVIKGEARPLVNVYDARESLRITREIEQQMFLTI